MSKTLLFSGILGEYLMQTQYYGKRIYAQANFIFKAIRHFIKKNALMGNEKFEANSFYICQMKNFVSESKESSRMFKSDWLEPLSKVHFSVPLIIYVPVIGFFFWRSFTIESFSLVTFFLSFLSGLLFWTATEYFLHRFIFHYYPNTKWGQRLHFIFHGVHHDFPNDRLRLVMPPSVSIPLALGFYYLFQSVLPTSWLPSFFSAFLIGYLIYDMSHYAFHHLNLKNPILKKLKQHHMRHHFNEPNKGYGVSSVLWDKILDSDFKK
ncbi:MAG: sterol desaturase family protein [Cyclobacteriaceae bacterium]